MKVQLCGETIVLVLPRSFTVRVDIVGAQAHSVNAARAAALGACWQAGPSLRAPSVSWTASSRNAAIYGAAVLDELAERKGFTLADFYTASKVALDMCAVSIVSEEEVAEAEGFTAPDTAQSTG